MLTRRLLISFCLLLPAGALAAEPQTQPRTVTFGLRDAGVGDVLVQTVNVNVQLDTTVRDGDKVIEKNATQMTKVSQREIATQAVTAGRSVAVKLDYKTAERKINDSQPEPQPVAGKTYHCQRQGEKLHITDATGSVPSFEEFEIVSAQMQALGKANPLGKYLAGKTFTVGQKLAVPKEVAAELLGLQKPFGTPSRFELTLKAIRTIDDQTCAEFHALVEAAANDGSQMRMIVEGPLVMQAASCRAVSAEFTGPVGMSETQGGRAGRLQVTGTGKLTIAINTKYTDASATGRSPLRAAADLFRGKLR